MLSMNDQDFSIDVQIPVGLIERIQLLNPLSVQLLLHRFCEPLELLGITGQP